MAGVNANVDLVLKTHKIIFVLVVLKVKPQHTISSAAISIMQAQRLL